MYGKPGRHRALTRRDFLKASSAALVSASALGLGGMGGLLASGTALASATAELSLDELRLGNVFLDDQTPGLTEVVRDESGEGGSYTLASLAKDAYGNTVAQRSDTVTLSSNGTFQQEMPINGSKRGYYTASASLESGGSTIASDETSLALLASPPSASQPDSPWGIGGGGAFIGIRFDEQSAHDRLQLEHEAGIAFSREEIFWDNVEPSQGQWDWGVFDPSVEYAREQKVLFMDLLDYFASWSVPHGYNGAGGSVDFDTAVENYANYVYQTVSRYKPGGTLAQQKGWSDGYGIRHWEVWNEPPTFWFGSAEQFGQLVRAASVAIRRADPQAFVIISNGGPTFDQAVIDVAGIGAYDAMAIHLYPGPTGPEVGGFVESIQRTRAFLDSNGGQNVAVWITEMGWDTSGGVSEWDQASYIVRANVQSYSSGVERCFIFTFDYGTEPPGWGIVHDDLTPKIAYTAYATLTNRLSDARPSAEVPIGSALRAYVFDAGSQSIAVVWSIAEDGELTMSRAGQDIKAYDLMNNPTGNYSGGGLSIALTGKPVFLIGSGVTARALADTVRQGVVSGITPLGIEIAQLSDLPTNLPSLTVTIINRINVIQSGTAKITLPDGWRARTDALPFGPLAPSESVTLSYVLDQAVTNDDNTYPVTVEVRRSDGTLVSESRTLFVTAVVRGTPNMDGKLSDWSSGAPVHLTSPEQVIGIPNWTPQDLSAIAWTMWDDQNLYFAAQVTDNTFNQPYTDGNIWQGDSVQLFLDPLNDKSTHKESDDQELGLALTDNGPEVFRWSGGAGYGYVKSADLATLRGDVGNVNYEVAIPLSELSPLEAAAGSKIGFTFLVNENDGRGREGWIEWTRGIGNAWTPSLFSTWTFVDALGRAAIRAERRTGVPVSSPVSFTLADTSARLQVKNDGIAEIQISFNGGRVITLTTDSSTEPDTYHISSKGTSDIDVSRYVRAGKNTMAVRPLGKPGREAVLAIF